MVRLDSEQRWFNFPRLFVRLVEQHSGFSMKSHFEIDAESRLDLGRHFDIRRTPTVLVVNSNGHIVRRATGAPRKADVIAALGELM